MSAHRQEQRTTTTMFPSEFDGSLQLQKLERRVAGKLFSTRRSVWPSQVDDIKLPPRPGNWSLYLDALCLGDLKYSVVANLESCSRQFHSSSMPGIICSRGNVAASTCTLRSRCPNLGIKSPPRRWL